MILNDPILLMWGYLRSASYGALAPPKTQFLNWFRYISNWKTYKQIVFFALLSTGLVSCGYRAVTTSRYESDGIPIALSIPLIHSDNEGILRSQLAEQLSASGKYRYTSRANSRYQLIVKTKSNISEQIGYVWDRDPKTGQLFEPLILFSNEGRRLVTLTVSIYDTHAKKNVVKSFNVTDHVDYDFVNPTVARNVVFTDLLGQRQTALQYSYGQLDSEEGSKLESYQPLYQNMAKTIVDILLRQKLTNS